MQPNTPSSTTPTKVQTQDTFKTKARYDNDNGLGFTGINGELSVAKGEVVFVDEAGAAVLRLPLKDVESMKYYTSKVRFFIKDKPFLKNTYTFSIYNVTSLSRVASNLLGLGPDVGGNNLLGIYIFKKSEVFKKLMMSINNEGVDIDTSGYRYLFSSAVTIIVAVAVVVGLFIILTQGF